CRTPDHHGATGKRQRSRWHDQKARPWLTRPRVFQAEDTSICGARTATWPVCFDMKIGSNDVIRAIQSRPHRPRRRPRYKVESHMVKLGTDVTILRSTNKTIK